MKTLKLTFRSGSHSTRTMQLKYVAEELDEATIKQARLWKTSASN